MVEVKNINMRTMNRINKVGISSVKCDWYKADIFSGYMEFTVIETFRDKRGSRKL